MLVVLLPHSLRYRVALFSTCSIIVYTNRYVWSASIYGGLSSVRRHYQVKQNGSTDDVSRYRNVLLVYIFAHHIAAPLLHFGFVVLRRYYHAKHDSRCLYFDRRIARVWWHLKVIVTFNNCDGGPYSSLVCRISLDQPARFCLTRSILPETRDWYKTDNACCLEPIGHTGRVVFTVVYGSSV